MSDILLQSRPELAPGVRLQSDRLTGEPMLLSPEQVVILNATAHSIVLKCDGSTSIQQLLDSLATEYEASLDVLQGEVLAYLSELHEKKLVIFSP